MTPAMQAARDRVVEAAKRQRIALNALGVGGEVAEYTEAFREFNNAVTSLFEIEAMTALEAQEKEQADAEG